MLSLVYSLEAHINSSGYPPEKYTESHILYDIVLAQRLTCREDIASEDMLSGKDTDIVDDFAP